MFLNGKDITIVMKRSNKTLGPRSKKWWFLRLLSLEDDLVFNVFIVRVIANGHDGQKWENDGKDRRSAFGNALCATKGQSQGCSIYL